MSSLKSGGAALCLLALAGSLLQLVLPHNSLGKLFCRLTGIALTACLCLAVLPRKTGKTDGTISLPELTENTVLSDSVTQQVERAVRQTATQQAEAALSYRGVTAEKITVITDISDDGGISIEQVVITVDKQSLPAALAVCETLKKQWQVPVKAKGA